VSEFFVRIGDAGKGCIAVTAVAVHVKSCPAARRRGTCGCDAERLWQEMFSELATAGQPWRWLADHAGAAQPEETTDAG